MDTPLPKPRLTEPRAETLNSAIYFGALEAANSVIFYTHYHGSAAESERAEIGITLDDAWTRFLNFCAVGAYTKPAGMLSAAAGVMDKAYRPSLPTTLAELPVRLAAHNAAAKAARRRTAR